MGFFREVILGDELALELDNHRKFKKFMALKEEARRIEEGRLLDEKIVLTRQYLKDLKAIECKYS